MTRKTREAGSRLGIRIEFPDFVGIMGKYEAMTPQLALNAAHEHVVQLLAARGATGRDTQEVWEAVLSLPAETTPHEALARLKKITRHLDDLSPDDLQPAILGAGAMQEVSRAIQSIPFLERHREAFAVSREFARHLSRQMSADGDHGTGAVAAASRGRERPPLCDDAFRALFITQGGDVFLDCEAGHVRTDLLGSLNKQSLSEIWNGDRIRGLRQWYYALQDHAERGRSERR
jgi:hypothetical protein